MTVCCPTIDGTYNFGMRTEAGSSEVALSIGRLHEESLRHFAEPRIESLAAEIDQLVSEAGSEVFAEGSIPVDIYTADAALQFARILPWSLPLPEVASDADGDISFDWVGPSGKMFSVSFNRSGRIAYAGRFGERSKIHGTEQLSEACPQEVMRGISRATR